MLSTHYKKDAQLIAATISEDTDKLKTKIYFHAPNDDDDVTSSDSDSDDDEEEEEEYFRIPMAKKMKKEKESHDEYKCKGSEYLVPYYNPKERITMFIAGAQNCGKSYFVAEFLKTYKMIHPRRPIYLLTGLSEKDKHFEKFDLRQIIMDSTNISELDLEKLRTDDKSSKRRSCLMIFNDTDRIRDKGLMNRIYKLLDNALVNGKDYAT